MTPPEDRELDRMTEAVAAGRRIDWDLEMSATPRLMRQMHRLRAIEKIAAAYQGSFTWNGLEVRERIGAGSSGEVYRAYDPRLDREVALKLVRVEDVTDEADYLDEARKLARVRHRNVVTVHGVDRSGDNVGLWCEMISGRTLEELLRDQGQLGGSEAALIGIELCRALAAVHAAGLVHGDVKAANVMRSAEGAIVLLDFGSGHRTSRKPDGPIPISGTPLILSAEALLEGRFSTASDIYALGVLLYHLLTRQYPIPATTWDELLERHIAGKGIPLRDLRPDLDHSLVRVVEKALQRDPAKRYESAGEMEQALATVVAEGAPTGKATPARNRVAFGLVALGLVGLAAFGVIRQMAGPEIGRTADHATQMAPGSGKAVQNPVAENAEPSGAAVSPALLSMTATLYRSGAGGPEPVASGAAVREGEPFYLEVRPVEDAHVYVLNEDETGALYLLFPLPGFDTQNPLPAGQVGRLPGRRNGIPEEWELSAAGGRETILVIASRHELPGLERRLAAFAVPADAAAAEMTADFVEDLRGFGRTKPAAALQGTPGTRLAALARELAESPSDQRIWVQEITLNGQERAGGRP